MSCVSSAAEHWGIYLTGKLHHPKDKSWSSFDLHAAVPSTVLFSILLWLTNAFAATAVSSSASVFTTRLPKVAKKACALRKDRLTHWIGVGAQASPTVLRLVKQGATAAAKNGLSFRGLMQPGLQPSAGLTPSSLPGDAIEVGRILDAWGVKGWVKILPHSTDPEALFAAKILVFCRRLTPKFRPGFTVFSGTVTLSVDEAKVHSDTVVAKFLGLDDRNAAEALRGRAHLSAAQQLSRSLQRRVLLGRPDRPERGQPRRCGPGLGARPDGPQAPHSVLCVEYTVQQEDGTSVTAERMIPFVSVYVDAVDIAGKCITVDWQPDY